MTKRGQWTHILITTVFTLFASVLMFGGQTLITTAQTTGQTPIQTTGQTPIVTTGQTPGACTSGQLCNPLKSKTIQEFLLSIIEILLVFAIPVIVFFIMYAGFLFVTARGNEGQITTARNTLTWAVIGGVIILSAELVIKVIQGTVKGLAG